MERPVQSAAVLGAGVMGAQIAAHLANAGLQVTLLDVSREAARKGLDRLKQLKPDPVFLPEFLARIRIGSFDELQSAGSADWIVEAVIESLEVKQALLARVEEQLPEAAVVSSNTSGIPIAAIAAGRSAAFRQRFLGTHFFNPPRYLRLVEIVPTEWTDPSVTRRLSELLDRRLGKGVVPARDTPGFIANRLGIFGALRLIEALESGDFTVEEIDAVTGAVIGRPKSATFRTLDIAGLDVFARVATDLSERLAPDDGARFRVPPTIAALVARGRTGEKAGAGFYKRVKGDDGSTILAVDPATGEYRDTIKPRLSALDAVRGMDDVAERIRTLFLGRDKVGSLLRATLGATLEYAARVSLSIAHAPSDVDRAMRLGFGWTLGPFETWDAIGHQQVLDACGIRVPPPLVADALASGRPRLAAGPGAALAPGLLRLTASKTRQPPVKRNAGASLIDLGDGVLAVEFHAKMNVIGEDALAMLRAGVAEAEANFRALVIGTEAEHFSAGANLMLLLLEAQEGNWDDIDAGVRAFQATTMALTTAGVPVVAAPAGLALGGGCEICLHADRVRAAAETYMGLVEAGVGLIPAGGGTKEMLLRASDRAGANDPSPWVQAAFEAMAFAKVSTSGPDARRLGYLRDVDEITMNVERTVDEAVRLALSRSAAGYQPRVPRSSIVVGGRDLYATLTLGVHLAVRAGRATEHDARIATRLAWVLSGGDVPHRTTVSEQHLLDLEREAFLSLCGESKTLERIAHTLKTGKPLRN